MEARKKAFELFNKMYKYQLNKIDNVSWDLAKKQALIAVDKIIEALESFGYVGAMFDDFKTEQITNTSETNPTDYWYEVKQEIEKL